MPISSGAAPASSGATSELWALARIVETSDLIRLPDGREFLLTPATPDLVDCLATFGAQDEDMEDEGLAMDWSHGAAMWVNGEWRFPILIQDGEREPEEYAGGGIR